jgi:DNA-binding transcriptional LysR family regulator
METENVPLPHLTTFSQAAEMGSFTAAANALGLSQAAVSQRVHALEQAVDKALFERRGGRVLLTDAGRRLYDYAQQILDLHRQARRELSGIESPVLGDLELAASSIPGEHLLPALLSDFGRKYPHIRIRASVGNSAGVMGQLERGEVSLGLVGTIADNPHLAFHALASDRLVVVVAPNHRWSKQKQVTLKQLSAEPLVLREVGSGLRHCFERSLETAGRSICELRVVLELGSNEAIKEAVLRGVGVAVLSTYAVQRELTAGQLLALPVKDLNCNRSLFVVHDRRRTLPLPARLFLTQIENNPSYHVAS